MLSNRAVRLIALAFTAVLAVNTLGALTVPVTSESAAEAIPAETNTEASEASTDFKDIKDKSKYYYEPVKWAAKYGITTGYKDGTFKPGNIVTRAQMVTFLWRLCGSPEPSIQKSKFKDIKSSDYWYKPAIWGNENHIVEGYKDGTFRPQTACTRAQAVPYVRPERSLGGYRVVFPRSFRQRGRILLSPCILGNEGVYCGWDRNGPREHVQKL